MDFRPIFGKKSNIFTLIGLLILAIAIPIGFNLANTAQVFRSQAAGEAVSFSGQNVFQKDSNFYLKPTLIDPTCVGGFCQYKYEVNVDLNPPEIPVNQSMNIPSLVTTAYAQTSSPSPSPLPPTAAPSPVPTPTPSPSPVPHSCTYDQACILIPDKSFTGSKYCVIPNKTQCTNDDVVDAVCTISIDDPTPGCGVAPSSLISACTPSTTTAALGSTVTWTIKYNSGVSNFVSKTTLAGDPNISPNFKTGADARGTGIGNGQNSVTFSAVYTQPGQFTPQASLEFGSLGKTNPAYSCSPLTVGASSINANIAGNPSLTTGSEGTYALSVNETNQDPLLSITKVEVLAARADAQAMTQDECKQGTLVSGKCLIYSQGNLPRSKTYTNNSIKWKPTLPANVQSQTYYLYVNAESSMLNASAPSATCTGLRGNTGSVAPCGGTSSADVTVNLKPAYTGFKIATRLQDLDSSPVVQGSNITTWPQTILFPPAGTILNDWQTPGPKVVYVKFISNNGKELIVNKTINLVLPDPQIRQAKCDLSVDGKNLNVTLRGYNFGPQANGKVSANGTNLAVSKWTNNIVSQETTDLILATLSNPSLSADSTKNYNLVLTRADGATVETQCSVGGSSLNIGAKIICRAPSNLAQSNVDLILVSGSSDASRATNKVLKKKVTINKDGTLQGLDTLIQACNYYKLSLKIPNGLRRNVEFQALEGTTTIPDFTLPVGDIFPAGGDGKINSLDRAEIVRQWAASLPTTQGQLTATDSGKSTATGTSFSGRSGDLNGDGVINSFDFACMIGNFNQQDDPEPTAGSVDVAKLGNLCEIVDELTSSPAPAMAPPTDVTTVVPIGSGTITIPSIPDILSTEVSCDSLDGANSPPAEHGLANLSSDKIASLYMSSPTKTVWLALKNPQTSKVYYLTYSSSQFNPNTTISHFIDTQNPLLGSVPSSENITLSPDSDYILQAWLVDYNNNNPVQMTLLQEKTFRLNTCPVGKRVSPIP